jgi:hypothetical protein
MFSRFARNEMPSGGSEEFYAIQRGQWMSVVNSLVAEPYPLRLMVRELARRLRLGSYRQRLRIGAIDRPHYGYCVYHAADLARKLGIPRISVLEFGVAGGNGVLNLEYHARQVTLLTGVEIDIYGFDTGEGLPAPLDYRDLPYHWKEGFYRMDVEALSKRLQRTKLVLGDIRETAPQFFQTHDPAPIGAIAYDLDFYSSTVSAFRMLEAGEKYYLPRVFCYFDDTLGTETELYNDFTGVRLAINEFNRDHDKIKFGLPYHLLSRSMQERWYQQLWICHFFEHAKYNSFVSQDAQQNVL